MILLIKTIWNVLNILIVLGLFGILVALVFSPAIGVAYGIHRYYEAQRPVSHIPNGTVRYYQGWPYIKVTGGWQRIRYD